MLYAPLAALAKLKEGAKQHVDVLGSLYSTVSYAYSTSRPSCEAHAIVERRLRQFASPSSSILYLDGEPAQEKKDTHQARVDIRFKALAAVAKSVEHLVDLVEHGRRGLVEYLRSRHWHVIECPTEADVEIGKLCGPDDVVVSGDSDLLMYEKVHEVW
ncbi:hypothetical protein CPB97_009714 [Podila verticillata]|nr:hypothetical protein CPB97_009714 [Podila verticillata]